jgi:kynureninase
VAHRYDLAGGQVIERARAERLDAEDPLAPFRARFVIGDPETIYLDGNSLGRLPIATRERIGELVEQWGTQLVTAWDEWIELPARVGDLLAETALGARPGEVIVSDSTTVNLYKLASALLAERPGALVAPRDEFPTDRYVLEGLAAAQGRELRLFESDPLEGPTAEDVERACAAQEVALVCLSQVNYRSGALADTRQIESAVHAPVIWDLSHSAGVVAPEGIGLAVGCTYKYLNAGPGAPAFLYVREELQPGLRTPIQGWFGQRRQFEMERRYDPQRGVGGFLAGTPNIPALVAVEEGARLVAEAGLERLRAKAEALTTYLVELHDAWLAPLGFELGSPRDPQRRGAHVSLRHPEAWPISRALIELARVIPDFRGPDSIRLGLPPLYTRFVDVHDAGERLRALVERGEQRGVDPARRRVT